MISSLPNYGKGKGLMDLKLTTNPIYTNNGAKGVQYDATNIESRERDESKGFETITLREK